MTMIDVWLHNSECLVTLFFVISSDQSGRDSLSTFAIDIFLRNLCKTTFAKVNEVAYTRAMHGSE